MTYRNDRAYTRRRDALRKQARKSDAPCHLCGKPIQWDVPYTHPLAFTADHLTPIALGGSMTGPLKPAHRSCNSRRGIKPLNEAPLMPRTTREW